MQEDRFVDRIVKTQNENFYLKGRAGIGKSWFLNSLIDKISKKSSKKIFFLKAVSLDIEEPLDQQLNKQIFGSLNVVSFPVMTKKLQNTILIIDGLDEVAYEFRDPLVSLIKDFKKSYYSSNVLVTSRPLTSKNIAMDFKIITIDPLTIDKVNEITEERFSLDLLKTVKSHLQDGDSIENRFVNPRYFIKKQNLSGKVLSKIFEDFLNFYNLNIKSDNHYLFRSTFRDIDILEEIFIDYYLFEGESRFIDGVPIQLFGRTKLYELWIKLKIQGHCAHLEEHLGSNYPDLVFTAIFELCKNIYNKSGIRPSSMKFMDDVIDDDLGGLSMKSILIASDLFKAYDDYLMFRNHSLDEYFVSTILKSEIDSNPKNLLSVISVNDYHSASEILPFLVGHYENVEEVMSPLINSMQNSEREKSFYHDEFPIYFASMMKTEGNLHYVNTLLSSNLNTNISKGASLYLENFED